MASPWLLAFWWAASAGAVVPALSNLPATFVGTLPCADCPGISYQVNLLVDHTFVSRMTYEERPARFDDHGSWRLADGGRTLVLQGERGAPVKFAIRDDGTLRMLDSAGREIASPTQSMYALARAPAFATLASSGGTAAASLENTDWILIRLADSPVDEPAQKAPRFVLNSATQRMSGFGGCNRLVGNHALDGNHLKFLETASTKMACRDGQRIENEFLQALPRVNRFEIHGQRLELYDAGGRGVATFEAGRKT